MHDGILSLSCIRAQEEAEFREFAARPNVLDLIPKRIAPQIFGSERIKEAVACLLFGGSRKVCNPFSRNIPLLNQHKLQPSHAPLLESLQPLMRNAEGPWTSMCRLLAAIAGRHMEARGHQRAPVGRSFHGQVAVPQVCVQDSAHRRVHLRQGLLGRRSHRQRRQGQPWRVLPGGMPSTSASLLFTPWSILGIHACSCHKTQPARSSADVGQQKGRDSWPRLWKYGCKSDW